MNIEMHVYTYVWRRMHVYTNEPRRNCQYLSRLKNLKLVWWLVNKTQFSMLYPAWLIVVTSTNDRTNGASMTISHLCRLNTCTKSHDAPEHEDRGWRTSCAASQHRSPGGRILCQWFIPSQSSPPKHLVPEWRTTTRDRQQLPTTGVCASDYCHSVR